MRNLKKFLALVLAMLMVVSASATVSAFDDVDEDGQYTDAINDLVDKGIITGFSSTEFKPDENVTRWQFALMLIKGYTGITDSSDWENGVPLFDDIEAGQYVGAIGKAVGAGIIKGRSATSFDPAATVNYSEALTMAVRALGFETTDKDGIVNMTYPTDYLAKAMELGLTDNLTITDKYQPLTRAETAQIIYNIIYADRFAAAGEDAKPTFAEQNFDEAGAANVTTFAITGTPKQALDISQNSDADDETVVLSKVAKNGDFVENVEFKAADLGIDFDDVEDMFGYTVDLVNYNAKKNTFAKAIIDDSTILTNSSVALKTANDNKISINGKTYYVVDEYAEEKTIRNEIKLYNVSDDYDLLAESDISGNYQLVLFDDDKDGIFDRALYYPVYVSVYYKKESDGKDKTIGAWDGTPKNVYSTDLVKGDVFAYTYNPKTLYVNVLDEDNGGVVFSEGTVTKVNTTKFSDGNVTVTIDGKIYTLSNQKRENGGLNGANLKAASGFEHYNNIIGRNKADNGDVTPTIAYNTFASDLTKADIGVGVAKFYSIGSNIIYIYNVVSPTATQKYAVIKEVTAFDTGAIYFDMYIDGKLVEDAPVVKIGDDTIKSMSALKLNSLIQTVNSNYTLGKVVKYTANSDGTYTFIGSAPLAADYGLTEFSGSKLDTYGVYFKDGIADSSAKSGGTSFLDAIRTKASTVFYFIDRTTAGTIEKVSTFIGKPGDDSTIAIPGTQNNDANTTADTVNIYADKFGFGSGATNGEASIVIVEFISKADIVGFGGAVNAADDSSVIYIDSDVALTPEIVYGSDFGLTGSNATKQYYSYSKEKIAINMKTGATVDNIYSTVLLEKDSAYKVDKNYIVIDADTTKADVYKATLATASLVKGDFNDGRNWTIKGVTDAVPAVTVTSVAITNQDAFSVKSSLSDVKGLFGDKTYSVYYMVTDKKFVGVVVNVTTTPTTPTNVTTNAKYDWSGKTYGAYATVSGDNAYATVQLYDDEVAIGGAASTKATGSADAASTYTVKVSKLNTTTNAYEAMSNVGVVASYASGVLTVSKFVNSISNLEINLAAGDYMVEVTFSISTTPCTVTYFATAK